MSSNGSKVIEHKNNIMKSNTKKNESFVAFDLDPIPIKLYTSPKSLLTLCNYAQNKSSSYYTCQNT